MEIAPPATTQPKPAVRPMEPTKEFLIIVAIVRFANPAQKTQTAPALARDAILQPDNA